MEKPVEIQRFTRGAKNTVITAAGMTGVGIGAYHVKNFVSDATDNEILGIAAGIGTLLLGAMVVNGINRGVDKSYEVKRPSFLIEVADEGVDFLEQDSSL